MSEDKTQYLSEEKKDELKRELKELKETKVPQIAKRIDEAKQMGDLSENAEYHAAREDMAWAQGRVNELEHILSNAEVITKISDSSGVVNVGSTIVIRFSGIEKRFTIVGPQEADPMSGKISNESPLGEAFLGRAVGDKVKVKVPAGMQEYEILDIK